MHVSVYELIISPLCDVYTDAFKHQWYKPDWRRFSFSIIFFLSIICWISSSWPIHGEGQVKLFLCICNAYRWDLKKKRWWAVVLMMRAHISYFCPSIHRTIYFYVYIESECNFVLHMDTCATCISYVMLNDQNIALNA